MTKRRDRPSTDTTPDPVANLLIAVFDRAWQDATGSVSPTCGNDRQRIELDARMFLTVWMVEAQPHYRPHGRMRARF